MEDREDRKEQGRRSGILYAVFALLLAALASFVTTMYFLRLYEKPAYAPLTEMADTIEREYYFADDTTNDETLIDSALRGMIGGIGDVYAEYLTEEEYQELLEEETVHYRGIGISVSVPDERGSRILRVYDASPAMDAGIVAGDVIVRVNGTACGSLTLPELMDLFTDGDDEKDELTLLRGEETYSVTLEKREVYVPRVFFEMLADGKGLIRIEEFSGDVVPELAKAIESLTADGAASLIIDLRDNPGGGLDEVLGTVDCILNKGELIASVRSRAGEEEVYRAETDGIDLPIAIIVNGNSASGSEMFTGALKDNGRAVVIGTKTYGKGIVQSYYRLRSNGGWVKLTTDAYYTPSGVCIHGEGITPDIVIEQPDPDGDGYIDYLELSHEDDVQLQQAIRQLDTIQ